MAATLLALLVLVMVSIATFGLAWLGDRRDARARIIKDRHAAEKVSDLQKTLSEANINIRPGTFLGLCAVTGVVATILAYSLSGRVEVAWIALLVGFVLPYFYISRVAKRKTR